jgi:hypothetical protein
MGPECYAVGAPQSLTVGKFIVTLDFTLDGGGSIGGADVGTQCF